MRMLAFKVQEKRIALPFRVITPCPNCKALIEIDAREGVDTPNFGTPTKLYGLCPQDDCEFSVTGVVVSVVLEASVITAPDSPAGTRLDHAQIRKA